MQQALPAGAGDTQTASPSTGAKSTVRSNPDAMSLRNCMVCLYTSGQQRCESKSREDVRS
jgi:hypothetical protein